MDEPAGRPDQEGSSDVQKMKSDVDGVQAWRESIVVSAVRFQEAGV
jgi:hypothetical protein